MYIRMKIHLMLFTTKMKQAHNAGAFFFYHIITTHGMKIQLCHTYLSS